MLDHGEAELRATLGSLVFGVDDDSMESVVLDLLRQRGWTLGLAESLTGGLLAARLTAVPGASDVLRGSIVSYASSVKFDLLDVTPGPVVNEPVAAEMAEGARRILGADVGVGLTGVAGPAEQEDVPVGTVCLGIALPTATTTATLRLGTQQRAGPPVRRDQRPRSAPAPADARRRELTCRNPDGRHEPRPISTDSERPTT